MASETKCGPVRVLHLEDSEIDHLLVQSMMESDGLVCEFVTAHSCTDFTAALTAGKFDLIISDYTLPSFDGLSGLFVARKLAPKTPFVFFSGTIGEETAVESLKNGASDYILKSRPRRLVPAIRHALQTAREQALLEESQNRNREQAALLDKARDGIMVCDLNNRVVYWNQGAERIYGWSSAEAVGQDVLQLLFQGKRPTQLQESLRSTSERGEWTGELDELTKDGRAITVQVRATLVRDESGEPKSLLLINTDITESKQLEEKFLRAQRMESLGVLVSGIAHDLNNALSPILIGIEIMRKDTAPEEGGILTVMEKSARRGAEMVKQILAFARGSDAKKTPMDLSLLVKEMGKVVEGTFSRNVRCEVKLDKGLWPVSAISTQIYQVLMNLCVNAKDAMPEGGSLKLAAQNVEVGSEQMAQYPDAKPGNYLCISVSDTGSGIPPAQLKKIFEPFFSTKPVGKGTGLGLSTSLEIIRNHGGFMTVHSEVGVGTEFKCYLPATVKSRSIAALPDEQSLPSGHGECILVVDQEAAIVALTRTALENFGYQVIGMSSTWEANAYLAEPENVAQMIIVDPAMPFMEGMATIITKERDGERIKIVALGVPQNLQSQLVPDAVVPKPFAIEQLLLTVQQVLAHKNP